MTMRRYVVKSVVGGLFLAVAVGVSASSGGPPPGSTGAPGEETCMACHGTRRTEHPDSGLFIAGLPEHYEPGKTYDVTVTVSEPGRLRWGFQATVLDESGRSAGDFLIPDPTRLQIVTGEIDGRERRYVQHTEEGTQLGTLDAGNFTFGWTAPESDVGDVTLYAAGNAANGNFSQSGDRIHLAQVTIRKPLPVEEP